MSTKTLLIMTILALSITGQASAQNHKKTSGQFTLPIEHFLEHRADGEKVKYNPLLIVEDIYIPTNHKSILEAMKYVLAGTSYDINSSVLENPNTAEIVKKNLPDVQRNMKKITRLEALRILIGEHHKVLIDPVIRQIGFDLTTTLAPRHKDQ